MEMLVLRDIIAISIPFSAGVMSAAYLPLGELSLYLAASLCCVVCFLCAWSLCSRHSGAHWAIFMCFCAGAFVCLSHKIALAPERESPGIAASALQGLLTHIDETGFAGEECRALIKALLTGYRKELDAELTEAFRDAGAAHILALSGLHMGIIYGMLHRLMFWMGHSRTARTVKSGISILSCAFYTLMTGASASVVRALLFISLNELASLGRGRRREPMNVYCAALMLQLCFSPLSIRSPGFQLSYMAMLGIYLLFPILDGWWKSSGPSLLRRIWSASALSISCQLFTAPLAWCWFRSFPLYFLLTNLLILPLTEIFIISSVAALALEAVGICPQIIKNLSDSLAQIIVSIVKVISSIS